MAIRPSIKQLGTSSAIYGFGNLLNKFAAFLLIPIYTRYLSTSDVGVFALLEMMEILLITLVPLGVIRAMWRFFPEGKFDRNQIIISAYVGTMTLSIFALIIIGFFYRQISPLLGLQNSQQTFILIVLLNVLLMVGSQFIISIWQYQQKATHYIVFSVFQFVGILIASSILIIFFNCGIMGLLFGKTIVLGLTFLISIFLIFSNISVTPSYTIWKKLLKYGAPFIFLALVAPILTLSSRFFLSIFTSLEDIAIFFIAFKFGMLINMFLVVPLQRGLIPMIYRMGINNLSKSIYRDMLFYYTVIGSILFLVISLFIKPILGFVTQPEYLQGASIIPVVAMAYFIGGFQHFFTAGAALRDKTIPLAFSAISAITINLTLNYFLIKSFGITGAAWSTLISYSVLVIIIYFTSQKYAQINWGWIRLIKLGIILFITYFCFWQFQLRLEIMHGIIGVIALFIFFILLFITKTISYKEINGIRYLINQFVKIA